MADTRTNETGEPMLPAATANSPASNQRSQGQSRKTSLLKLLLIFFIIVIIVVVIGLVFYFLLAAQSSSNSPGLDFEPKPSNTSSGSSLIWFKVSDQKSLGYWIKRLKGMLDEYKRPRGYVINCDFHYPPYHGKVCYFDVKTLGVCSEEGLFGFYRASPCVFLKANKIYGWKPEYYNNTDNLPPEMPQDLKYRINEIERYDRAALNTVWVSCEGETPADKENVGPIDYYPQPGFPGYYFPYENNEGYLSPLVAVQFRRPRMGVLINVECRIWAKNADYDRDDQLGAVHFELLID